MMAWVVACAWVLSKTMEAWVAPSTMRCALLVDNSGMAFCFADQSAALPRPAVRTMSG